MPAGRDTGEGVPSPRLGLGPLRRRHSEAPSWWAGPLGCLGQFVCKPGTSFRRQTGGCSLGGGTGSHGLTSGLCALAVPSPRPGSREQQENSRTWRSPSPVRRCRPVLTGTVCGCLQAASRRPEQATEAQATEAGPGAEVGTGQGTPSRPRSVLISTGRWSRDPELSADPLGVRPQSVRAAERTAPSGEEKLSAWALGGDRPTSSLDPREKPVTSAGEKAAGALGTRGGGHAGSYGRLPRARPADQAAAAPHALGAPARR